MVIEEDDATMWIFHYLAPTQNEGGKIYTNQNKPLQMWNSWEHLVVLVQALPSKNKHLSGKRT